LRRVARAAIAEQSGDDQQIRYTGDGGNGE
jgi:hypothetical protein